MQIFHPGQGRAGDQQYQPQLCPGVSQQIDGDGVGAQRCRPAHRQKDQGQEPQTGPQDLGRAPSVAQSQMLGGEVGRRRGQPHRRQGQEHGVHRHQELIKPHDLRAHHAGQGHPVPKAQHLGHGPQHREKQDAPYRRHLPVLCHSHPPSLYPILPGGGL